MRRSCTSRERRIFLACGDWNGVSNAAEAAMWSRDAMTRMDPANKGPVRKSFLPGAAVRAMSLQRLQRQHAVQVGRRVIDATLNVPYCVWQALGALKACSDLPTTARYACLTGAPTS
jgi:hypothetical protein